MNGIRGFTLIEVLVATAIMGISLGVLLSGIAMGHREAFRGDQAREAALVAGDLLQNLRKADGSFSPGKGPVTGHPGWSYSLQIKDAAFMMSSEGMGAKELDAPGLEEVVLSVIPPGDQAPFVLTDLIHPEVAGGS
ncbi:MAG: type II secretion system protein [Desulfobacteraceae bacterium]|nr:type II secretion system protein [Desulfobacteraceae bacterium]